VYVGTDGPAHLKVFFWNNLVGRFTHVDAPAELQYAAAHRNTPGKYLIEMPVYLFPWTVLVLAAARRAWRARGAHFEDYRAVRFGVCASVPALVILSLAATARNIYVAPALPGAALLLGWWAKQIAARVETWDLRALRVTCALLLLSAVTFGAALILVGVDGGIDLPSHAGLMLLSVAGLGVAAAFALRAWREAPEATAALRSLLIAYAALLIGPALQIYGQADTWQDLAQVARTVERDAAGKPLLLLAPDETTRAVIDMYARTSVQTIMGPLNPAALQRMQARVDAVPNTLVLVLVPGRPATRGLGRSAAPPTATSLPWIQDTRMQLANSYALPHGRRYALLRLSAAEASGVEHAPIQ
jgi:4-amino-4-deoxy-L-arabinose transferase-like glycosyltransferase